ncbi:hypothetical protein MMAN_08010 [Mycobacterium mantenii]|uniref:Uncharacterized protein n=1 Tax=Mycobacterium mantenii TaxID=560555 RepID=A0A1X0G0U4_MYCNT|nr:DUF6065 family protein [Mycobacterium mantenii]MCV7244587.1 hypothetical protein [Mycobacterium mantenii]ORB07652.1 hypothetical protein BST30_06875 [Mycobacterium mantenii]BBY36667.1 hypothetical protein MMAN_08010 [Mycobacterium mantenii]
MSEKSGGQSRPLIAYVTHDIAPPISPAPIGRTWMTEMREGRPHRCLPMMIANQSGWEVRNRNAFTATWMGGNDRTNLMIAPDTRESGQFLPSSHFGFGILTWHLPMLFRTPPGYNLLVRGPANYPKDAISPLEGIVETDWSSSSFSMNWKFTREFMPVRFEVDEPICMIVPQRRAELEEFAPELRPIESDEELHGKHEFFLGSRAALGRETEAAAGAANEKQGDYARGRHSDGEPGAEDHQTRRHLRSFVAHQPEPQAENTD